MADINPRPLPSPLTSPLPSLLSQQLYAPTVFLCFLFFSRQRREQNHKHSICLHVDMSPLKTSVWSLEHTHLTLCTSLNKVYEFITVYHDAGIVDSVLLNTHKFKKKQNNKK